MDKKIAGLAGAMAVALVPVAAQALPLSPNEVMQVKSYGDLLEPIPNASLVLKAVASSDSARPAVVEKVQYHHHHHHHVLPRVVRHLLPHRHHHHYHHHHHHHHHY
jgi:hypothetical protein